MQYILIVYTVIGFSVTVSFPQNTVVAPGQASKKDSDEVIV